MPFNFNFKKVFNWGFPFLLLGFFLYTQGPVIYENFQTQGESFPETEFLNIETQAKVQLPNSNKNILIFWASWCAPCKLEMKRIKNSIESGNIPKKRVYAINPFESASQVQAFLRKNSYPFQFITPLKALRDIDIKATPTFIWLNGKKIYKMSTGIHLIGIYLLEDFLTKIKGSSPQRLQ